MLKYFLWLPVVFFMGSSCSAAELETTIEYTCHIANVGWLEGRFADGMAAGSAGPRAQQMEAIVINKAPAGLQYRAHVSCVGWQDWKNVGEMAGTTGRGLGMEALQFRFVNGGRRSIAGRVHVAYEGWHETETAMEPGYIGTTGKAHSLQAVQLMATDEPMLAEGANTNQAIDISAACWSPPKKMMEALDTVMKGTACAYSLGHTFASCMETRRGCLQKGVKTFMVCKSAVRAGRNFMDPVEDNPNEGKSSEPAVADSQSHERQSSGAASRQGDSYHPSHFDMRGL